MKFIYRAIWIAIIFIGTLSAQICPKELVYIVGFITGGLSLAFLNFIDDE